MDIDRFSSDLFVDFLSKKKLQKMVNLNNPLMGVIFILVLAIIAILTTVGIWKSRLKPIERIVVHHEPLKSAMEHNLTLEPRNVCQSPECIFMAHQLLNWRDTTVDPCDNFYRASCGNYIEHSIVDGTRNTKKSRIVKRLIKEFLVENKPTESKSEYTMKLLYSKCEELRNDTYFDLTHNDTMREVLNDIRFLGSWPILDKKWNASEFDLNVMLSNMAKLGHLDFGLFYLELVHGKVLRVGADYEVDHPPDHKMFEIIEAILHGNNITFNHTRLIHDIKKVYQFYEDLKMNTTGFTKLHEITQNIQFDKIFKYLIHPKKGNWPRLKSKIENADKVFKGFKDNTTHKNATLSRILANFLVFKFLENTHSTLSYKGKLAYDRSCDEVVIHTLPRATLRAFVRNHFHRNNTKIVDEMFEETRKTYLEIIGNTTWLSDKSRRRAILKIEKLEKMIGYPEVYEKPGALDKTFETLHTSESDSLYTLFKKINRYRSELLMDFVAFELSLNPMYDEYMEVNAYYASYMNKISIMVPFMDTPNVDASFPNYAKYGQTGDILGHEMGHSMDTTGIQWNELGHYEKWMTPEDEKIYMEKIQCLRDQYDDYDDPDFGRNLNSAKVINEIIADRHGIDASLHTYHRLKSPNDAKIIGFENVSSEKMLYHVLALDYCAPRSTVGLDYFLKAFTHPTNSFRVNGVFSNLKSFAETFNCPKGSPMNPEKKCHLFVNDS